MAAVGAVERARPAENPGLPFTEQMRIHTRTIHATTDVSTMARLAAVLCDRRLYANALFQFWQVWKALEEGLRETKHPALAGFQERQGELSRSKLLEQDLEFFLGPGWSKQCSLMPAAAAYVQHLRTLPQTKPYLLGVYAYHLTIAVTAGGQLMRKQVRNVLGLDPSGEGLRFFDCELRVAEVKAICKAAANTWPELLSQEQQKEVLAESLEVFRRNNAVIQSIPVRGFWPYMRAGAAVFERMPPAVKWGASAALIALAASLVALLFRRPCSPSPHGASA